MIQAAPLRTRNNGRPIKFTPERIQQIRNLVERGKNRHEIADLLDVTVGSLQVTCSRLGISLRQRGQQRGHGDGPNHHYYGDGPNHHYWGSTDSPSRARQHQQDLPPQAQVMTANQEAMEPQQPDSASFTLMIQYKGKERATRLGLTKNLIGQIALEAELRSVGIGELVSELITTAIKKGILQLVLDQQIAAIDPARLR
jgi:hypothetical protein